METSFTYFILNITKTVQKDQPEPERTILACVKTHLNNQKNLLRTTTSNTCFVKLYCSLDSHTVKSE